jgi:thymidine kinase
MSKLYFRYGAMNSGKSTALLQVAYNYEERSQAVLLVKPRIDAKGGDTVVSRMGLSREVDFLVGPEENLREVFANQRSGKLARTGMDVACLLIDESQFLTREQVDQALEIAVLDGVPVLAYGIRTDFQTKAFPGSLRLFELAHSIEELKTVCRCGRKALFNARQDGGKFVFEGSQVAIDGIDTSYESLCAGCYLKERDRAK